MEKISEKLWSKVRWAFSPLPIFLFADNEVGIKFANTSDIFRCEEILSHLYEPLLIIVE